MKFPSKKIQAYLLGHAAETVAANYLRLKCFRIIARRYRTKLGEVDIIAKRGRQLIFVEVKARKQVPPSEEVLTINQRIRISNAASLYLSRNPTLDTLDKRFDLLIISPKVGIKHIQNAW